MLVAVRRIALLFVCIVPWLAVGAGCGLDALDVIAIGCPCPKGYACSPDGPGCILPSGSGGGSGGGGGGGGAVPDASGPMADAGATDAGQATSPCSAYARALFCSSFEDPDFPEFTVRRAQGGAFVQDRAEVFRGSGSLRASTSAPSGFAALLVALDPPVVSGTLYLRAHVFVPSTSSNDANVFFLGNADDDAAVVGIDMDLAATERPELFLLGYGDYASSPDVVVPRDQWFCYQSEIAVADGSGRVTVSIDGTPAVALTGVTTFPPGGIDILSVGIGWTSDAPTTATVYYDEVVLDDAPVPCEASIAPI